jgi:hypothetical protein
MKQVLRRSCGIPRCRLGVALLVWPLVAGFFCRCACCGYALANKGHDTRALQAYLGHRNIQHTVRYTELSPTRFRDFWRE